MFTIKNLHISADKNPIINGVSLKIKPGEIHAIMGPNGAGKSTLANALMGHPKYSIEKGNFYIKSKKLTRLPVNKRAQHGLFLAFQHPYELPGVTVLSFLHTAVSALKKARGEAPLSLMDFRKLLREKLQKLHLEAKFMNAYMNEGFSGGEKKKMEILQMMLLEPRMSILDEIDSGLDVDSLKLVANEIKKFINPNRSILLITHYQRLLHYIKPNFVHILIDGEIVKSGTAKLAEKVEREGYGWIKVKCQMLNVKCY